MNTKNNSRFQKTDKKIREVFLSELKEKGIEQIKVSEICKKAEINRSSFYSHYDDIYDILKKLAENFGQELYDMFRKSYIEGEKQLLRQQQLLDFVTHIYEHKDFYEIYFSAIPFEHINPSLDQAFTDFVYPNLMGRGEYDESTGILYYTFFKAGLYAVLKQWLREGCQKTPGELTEIILKSLNK